MDKIDINLTNLDLLGIDLEYIFERQQLEEEEIFYKDKEFAEYCEDNRIKFLNPVKDLVYDNTRRIHYRTQKP